MALRTTEFIVPEGKRSLNLKSRTSYELILKKDAKKIISGNNKILVDLQKAMYAESKQSILFVFQAMDAAGKDSTIQKVFSGLNPQGISVNSFKSPSKEELSHDYMWRVYKKLPQRGHIGIFNRSHYEEVLVTKIHPEFILYQNIPGITSLDKVGKTFWQKRYDTINNFESHLHANGTKIVKFFLNVSKEEQKRRLISRMEVQEKNWKVSLGDTLERAHWDQYQLAYETAVKKTSTKHSPWYVIPADDKWTMRAIVSSIVLKEIRSLRPQFPILSEDGIRDMKEARNLLNKEK